jgi:hypothetical protein
VKAFDLYIVALFACAVGAGLAGVWAAGLKESTLSKWESMPRNKQFGAALALVCLIWCIPHAQPIVWDWMKPWLLPMALAFTVIGFYFLDYLFARAIGGFFILLTYYLLHESFTFHTPGAAVFAVLCWGLGILGLFFSGKPYLCRDMIRKIARSSKIKYLTVGYFSLFALFCLTAGILHLAKG